MALQYRSCEAPGLLKAAHGSAFIGVNVKYGEQFGDLEQVVHSLSEVEQLQLPALACDRGIAAHQFADARAKAGSRSEEHTSELQSRPHLVCRLLLEKKKTTSM